MTSLFLSLIVRTGFIFIGMWLLIYQIFRALEWITYARDPEILEKVNKKLQRATIILSLYVGLVSAIIFVEQIIPQQPVCLGLTCSWEGQKPSNTTRDTSRMSAPDQSLSVLPSSP
jgi:hypothetical protein